MLVKKDAVLIIKHDKKGMFEAKAVRDFDTNFHQFYPLEIDHKNFYVNKDFCTVTIKC